MAMKITDDCVACGGCVDECPNLAIRDGEEIFEIDPSLCTECVDSFSESQCASMCPADCIERDTDVPETVAQLRAKRKWLLAA